MNTDYTALSNSAMNEALRVPVTIILIVAWIWLIFSIIGLWKMYTKAGRPGWANLVPFYNCYCMCDIAFGNGWLFFILLLPYINYIFEIIMYYKFVRAYGHGVFYSIAAIIFQPVFFMIIGFGESEYIGNH